LLAKSDADHVFLTWEWLFTWWKHLGGGRELALITVRDGDHLLAIAPLALRRARVAAIEFPALEFLGHGAVGSDYLDVIVRRDRRAEALEALVEYFHGTGIRLDLVRVRDHGADVSTVVEGLARRGWRVNRIPIDVCPFIPLGGRSWPSYLSTVGP